MLNINKAVACDAGIVSNIINLSFAEQARILCISEREYPNYVAFEKPQDVIRAMENGESVYLLAEPEKHPIGTIRLNVDKNNPQKGYINRLAVLPEHRKNGYGKILMDFAGNELKKKGVITIEISIVKRFERLEAFYESLGYKATRDMTYRSLPFKVRHLEKVV